MFEAFRLPDGSVAETPAEVEKFMKPTIWLWHRIIRTNIARMFVCVMKKPKETTSGRNLCVITKGKYGMSEILQDQDPASAAMQSQDMTGGNPGEQEAAAASNR